MPNKNQGYSAVFYPDSIMFTHDKSCRVCDHVTICKIRWRQQDLHEKWLKCTLYNLSSAGPVQFSEPKQHPVTVKPVCNDHLYDKIYYLWFIQ